MADQERDRASIATTAVIAAAVVVVAAAKAIAGHPPPDRFLLHHHLPTLLAVVALRGHHLTAVVRRGHLRGDQPKEGRNAAQGVTVIGIKRVLIEAAVEVAAKVLGREVMKRRQKRLNQRKPAVSMRELKVKMKRKIRHSVRNLPTVLGRKLAMIVVKKETSKITTKENRQNRLRDLREHLTNQLGKNVCVGNHLRARHPQCPVQILVLLHRIVPGADSDLGAKRDLGPHRREVLRGRHHAVGRILLPLGVRGLDRETDLDRNKEENI